MLEVGRTYHLPIRGGLDVDIVGRGISHTGLIYVDHQTLNGPFFVGITRNDDGGDWVGHYDMNGRRLWEDQPNPDPLWDLVVPERFVNLNDVLCLIDGQVEMSIHHRTKLASLIKGLRLKEIVNA